MTREQVCAALDRAEIEHFDAADGAIETVDGALVTCEDSTFWYVQLDDGPELVSNARELVGACLGVEE